MNLLIQGGTVFLGRHAVDAALARGHQVTLFNRGRHNPQLFPDVEKLRGDRDNDLSAFQGRRFDAVIDLCGYRPEQVQATAKALRDSVDHYTFISTISVYRDFPPGRPFDENARLAEGSEGYGPLKARCEEALQAELPGRIAHVRPGLIVGPHDPTDRFTYWPRRVARGGEVLAPGRPRRAVQLIDARDLAEWCVDLAEQRRTGVFNAVGSESTLTMEHLLEECRAVAGSDARFTWMTDDELVQAGVQPWTELPLWISESDPDFGAMMLASNQRALGAGLSFRPLADTIRATLAWDRREGGLHVDSPARAATLTQAREAELLADHAASRHDAGPIVNDAESE